MSGPVAEARHQFDRHWQHYSGAGISVSKTAGAARFLQPVLERHQTQAEMRVLDLGCGDGVHAAYLAVEHAPGMQYWGLDLSVQALATAKKHLTQQPLAHFGFSAGDALSMPYKDGAFDAVFAYGVLAYTPDPKAALKEMVRVCRSGGILGFWVLPEPEGTGGLAFRMARALCRRLGRWPAKVLVHLGVLAMGVLPVKSGVNLKNSTWRQCAEVLEVSLLPRTLGLYSRKEIVSWVSALGLKVVHTDPAKPVLIWAEVP